MASINTKIKRVTDSGHWLAVICHVTDGMLFVDFETHDFPNADLRKVEHHIDCRLREAIEEADSQIDPTADGDITSGNKHPG